ncbi:MAG: right-handed parallel beta-helix repeat-containing protein, partial [Candidatus Thorarchaeota archaeon]
GVTNIIASKASNGDLFAAEHIDAWDDWEEFSVPVGTEIHTPTIGYLGGEDYVVISDLTMVMTENDITETSVIVDSVTGDVIFDIGEYYWGNNIGYAFIIDIAPGCDTTLERVGIIGANDGTQFQPVSPNHGFYITGPQLSIADDGGTHIARDCDFIGMGSNSYQPIAMTNSEIVVESCVFRDGYSGVVPVYCDRLDVTVSENLFENMGGWAVAWWGPSGSVADISNNVILDSGGLGLETYPFNPFTYREYEKNYISFENNDVTLQQYGDYGGIEIYNNIDDDDWADLVIKNNKFHSVGQWIYGPIFTANAHNAVIRNNIMTGSGPAAMYIGFFGTADRGLSIIGNNLEGWTVDGGPWEPYWHGMAAIWLEMGTSDCMVVGHAHDMVADFGTNNFLVGVTSVQGYVPGEYISDAMKINSNVWGII